MPKPIDSYILRDLLWYKGKGAEWTYELYKLSTENCVNLTPAQMETLINILSLMAQDDVESIKREAIYALANMSFNSKDFVTKCVEMGVMEKFVYTLLDYTNPCRLAIFSIIGSYFRLCQSENVGFTAVQLHLVDFMIACFASNDENLIIAASRAIYEMILHIQLILDFSLKGLFDLLALYILDDLSGKEKKTLPLVALVRRASEHIQPVTRHIVDSGCLGAIAHFVYHRRHEYQKLALGTIVNVALISMDYVIPLYGPDFFCDIVSILMLDDVEMKFYAANFVRQVTETSRKHTRMLVESGLLEALLLSLQKLSYVADPALMALANVLDSSSNLTSRFLELKGHLILAMLFYKDTCEYTVLCVLRIFTIIFHRGEPFSTVIANMDIYPRLVDLYRNPNSTRHLRRVVKDSARLFLGACTDWELIKEFFAIAPANQHQFVFKTFSEVLPYDVEERKAFLGTGGLAKINSFKMTPGNPLNNYVEIIKACFPPEVIQYCTPGFEKNIMKKVDNFVPMIVKVPPGTGSKKYDRADADINEEDDETDIN